MKLNKQQKEILTKWLSNISTYVFTAMPVGLFLSDGGIPYIVYIVLAAIGLLLLGTALFLNRKIEKEDAMRTEVKKGIFHIDKAEIAQETKKKS